ncbi:MAG: polyhydroxyalkanoate depolymerase [Beijerinckiaceae bacterium]
MLYDAYFAYDRVGSQFRKMASGFERYFRIWGADAPWPAWRRFGAMFELGELAGFTHSRPDFGIRHIRGPNGGLIDVRETIEASTPFCDLVRFSREDGDDRIRVLLVAPMSGHFATLLRATIRTLLQDFDVYVTDWRNARDIPLSEGVMTLDRYTGQIIDFARHIGPRAHIVAVCQPVVAALVATAVMAKEKDPMQPASLTLMAGPIDTRISPTAVNELATSKSIEWFESNMISTVPIGLPGAGRRVYPGFVQLAAFMSMNAERHARSFAEMYRCRVEGEREKAEQIRLFYEEYFAVMDLDASFYLETIETIFQKHALPTGALTYNGEPVEPSAIRKTFLLTIEGERDDICAMGQTMAAHDLCSGLRPYMKSHHLQPGVGHYGVFSGKRWETQIYPVVRDHIQTSH